MVMSYFNLIPINFIFVKQQRSRCGVWHYIDRLHYARKFILIISFNTWKVDIWFLLSRRKLRFRKVCWIAQGYQGLCIAQLQGCHSHRSPGKWHSLDLCSRTWNANRMVPVELCQAVALVTKLIVNESRAEISSHPKFSDSCGLHKKD